VEVFLVSGKGCCCIEVVCEEVAEDGAEEPSLRKELNFRRGGLY
jgi:hypothetical protein